MTTPRTAAAAALLRNLREQFQIASYPPCPEELPMVSLDWLQRLLDGEVGTVWDSALHYDGPSLPDRLCAIEDQAATAALESRVEAVAERLAVHEDPPEGAGVGWYYAEARFLLGLEP